jgi:uncharacterized protein
LKKAWRGRRPFLKLFQTEFGDYVYDPGTNKLLLCEPIIFATLQAFQFDNIDTAIESLSSRFTHSQIVEALHDIIDAIEDAGILLSNPDEIRFDSPHITRLEHELNNNLGILIL